MIVFQLNKKRLFQNQIKLCMVIWDLNKPLKSIYKEIKFHKVNLLNNK